MKVVIVLNLMTSKYMDNVSIGKTSDLWAVGKCSKVVCTVSFWHKNFFRTSGRLALLKWSIKFILP